MNDSYEMNVEIHADAARVWDVMRDVERWHEWTASITRVERLDSGPFAVGSRVRIFQPKLPPALWTVSELEEGRGFTWVSRALGLVITGRHAIAPSEGGCRVTLGLAFGGLLGPLWARLSRGMSLRYMRMEADGLKARSERG